MLTHAGDLNLSTHRLRQFQERVNRNDRNKIFQADGRYTFFIPVDDGFQVIFFWFVSFWKTFLFFSYCCWIILQSRHRRAGIAPHMGGTIYSNVTFTTIKALFWPVGTACLAVITLTVKNCHFTECAECLVTWKCCSRQPAHFCSAFVWVCFRAWWD